MAELAMLPMAESWLNSMRGGDGHPVIIIPGFTVGDRSTVVMRKFLSSLGYLPLQTMHRHCSSTGRRDR